MSLWLWLPLAMLVAGLFFGLAWLVSLMLGVVLSGAAVVVVAFGCGLAGSLVTLWVAGR